MKYLIPFFILFCISCSQNKLDISSQPITRLPLHLSDPVPLKLKSIRFVVITKDNAGAVFAELEKQGLQPVLFGLSGNDYKALAVNIQDIKDYIVIEKKLLEKYREYYEGTK